MKQSFAGGDVGFGESLSGGRQLHVAFVGGGEFEQGGGFKNGEQVVHFEAEIFGDVIDVLLAAAIVEQFDEAGDAAGARVRNHLGSGALGVSSAGGRSELQLRLGHNLIYIVHVEDEGGGFAVARVLEWDAEIGADAGRIAAEDDDAVGEQDGFLDIVRDDEDAAGGDFFREPEFEKFVAQGFGGEHVERGEGLVHEKEISGSTARARAKPTRCFMPPESSFGEGVFKTFEADRRESAERFAVTFEVGGAAREERGFDVIEHGEPGKERKTLKDDGDVGLAVAPWACRARELRPKWAGRGRRACGAGWICRSRWGEQRDDGVRFDGEIDGGDDLNVAAVGLAVTFFRFGRAWTMGSTAGSCGSSGEMATWSDSVTDVSAISVAWSAAASSVTAAEVASSVCGVRLCGRRLRRGGEFVLQELPGFFGESVEEVAAFAGAHGFEDGVHFAERASVEENVGVVIREMDDQRSGESDGHVMKKFALLIERERHEEVGGCGGVEASELSEGRPP